MYIKFGVASLVFGLLIWVFSKETDGVGPVAVFLASMGAGVSVAGGWLVFALISRLYWNMP